MILTSELVFLPHWYSFGSNPPCTGKWCQQQIQKPPQHLDTSIYRTRDEGMERRSPWGLNSLGPDSGMPRVTVKQLAWAERDPLIY